MSCAWHDAWGMGTLFAANSAAGIVLVACLADDDWLLRGTGREDSHHPTAEAARRAAGAVSRVDSEEVDLALLAAIADDPTLKAELERALEARLH